MWKPRTFLLFLGALVLLGLLIFVLVKPNEPSYAGHTLSYWLNAPASAEQPDEAVRAIQAIGTNAIPTLLRWINYEPTPWKMKLASVPIVYRHGWARTLDNGPGSARATDTDARVRLCATNAIRDLSQEPSTTKF